MTVIKKLFSRQFWSNLTRSTHNQELEAYLSKASNLAELENMQRNWDREQRRNTFGAMFAR